MCKSKKTINYVIRIILAYIGYDVNQPGMANRETVLAYIG